MQRTRSLELKAKDTELPEACHLNINLEEGSVEPSSSQACKMGSRNVCAIVCACVCVGLLLVGILLGMSIKRLDTTEIGVMYDQVSKSLSTKVYTAGLHTGPVGFKFITAPSVYTTISSEITCLNKDGVEIKLSVTYQYKIKADYFREVLMDFKDSTKLHEVLIYVGESVLHDVCAQFNVTHFQYERKRFTDSVQHAITQEFDRYYTHVAGLQISNYDRPDSFEKAVEKKITASEDIIVAGKERKAAIIEAQTEFKVQSANANITLLNALSYEKIRKNQAENKANIIKEQFINEIKVYSQLVSADGLGLTTKGLISYMGIRTLESSQNPVILAVKTPANFAPVN